MKYPDSRFVCSVLLATVTVVGCGGTNAAAPDSATRTVRLSNETSAEEQRDTRTNGTPAVTSLRQAPLPVVDPGDLAVQFVIDSQRCYVDAAAARSIHDNAEPAVAERAIRDARPQPGAVAPRAISVAVTSVTELQSDADRSSHRFRVTVDRTETGIDGVSRIARAQSVNVNVVWASG